MQKTPVNQFMIQNGSYNTDYPCINNEMDDSEPSFGLEQYAVSTVDYQQLIKLQKTQVCVDMLDNTDLSYVFFSIIAYSNKISSEEDDAKCIQQSLDNIKISMGF